MDYNQNPNIKPIKLKAIAVMINHLLKMIKRAKTLIKSIYISLTKTFTLMLSKKKSLIYIINYNSHMKNKSQGTHMHDILYVTPTWIMMNNKRQTLQLSNLQLQEHQKTQTL